jgi:hypothetical protein
MERRRRLMKAWVIRILGPSVKKVVEEVGP